MFGHYRKLKIDKFDAVDLERCRILPRPCIFGMGERSSENLNCDTQGVDKPIREPMTLYILHLLWPVASWLVGTVKHRWKMQAGSSQKN